jgi:hypothetical protein
MTLYRNLILPFFSLFTSAGTLMCCALPALLVSLGLGASLAGFVSANSWVIAISEHKIYVFIASGLLLVMASILQYYARNASCPIDPKQAKICTRMRKINLYILMGSAAVWMIGFFFAFIAVHIFY